jgi:hypothetical protein
MANEFVAKNGLISQNNTTVSGSLTVTQGITGSFTGSLTGSLLGTASFASNGGVTQITAGTGITISSATGNVTINSTATGGGISQGKVVAIATGNSNLF